MLHALHRLDRIEVLEMQCLGRAVDGVPDDWREAVEQVELWGRLLARARRDYVFARSELAALMEQREALEASHSWPGYLRRMRNERRAERARAEARMAQPGFVRASDPVPDSPVFVDPAGCDWVARIESPASGFPGWRGSAAVPRRPANANPSPGG
ncbi:hypothetical protein [Marinimicrococcus flavescens]|uniref:Uncharacterized protein n=1 Tax=Marinimicrococcus flavescens TaxID=3031815 RepID=A0AAP3XS47_9PROT|nr:hypothetical protein [Marinimicrococcus flavescens]